jgi:hypothetical protein
MTTGVAADLDPLALERQVCFALAITNRAVLAVYRPLLEPLGLKVLTRINAAALAAGALDSELDR